MIILIFIDSYMSKIRRRIQTHLLIITSITSVISDTIVMTHSPFRLQTVSVILIQKHVDHTETFSDVYSRTRTFHSEDQSYIFYRYTQFFSSSGITSTTAEYRFKSQHILYSLYVTIRIRYFIIYTHLLQTTSGFNAVNVRYPELDTIAVNISSWSINKC